MIAREPSDVITQYIAALNAGVKRVHNRGDLASQGRPVCP
jgi:hypothetical protein